MLHFNVQPVHVMITLLTAASLICGYLWRLMRYLKEFRTELRVIRVGFKEMLSDLAVRNPEAMARVMSAIDDQSVLEFVREDLSKPRAAAVGRRVGN